MKHQILCFIPTVRNPENKDLNVNTYHFLIISYVHFVLGGGLDWGKICQKSSKVCGIISLFVLKIGATLYILKTIIIFL